MSLGRPSPTSIASNADVIDCVVLDFDGTFTRVEAEAAPFVSRYRALFDALVERDTDELWRRASQRIEDAPHDYGWLYDGKVVAPALADPYIHSTAVAQIVLDELGLLLDRDARTRALHHLYRDAYAHATTAFRPEAKRVLETLLEAGVPLRVVTNSMPDAVSAKLDALAPRGRERVVVHGDAKKFVLAPANPPDPRFDSLPDELALTGLPRRVHPRRGHYFDVLRAIWNETGAEPETTLVVGDIYELDLALPALLGARVHLMAKEWTAPWERASTLSHARGSVSESLTDVVEIVRASTRTPR